MFDPYKDTAVIIGWPIAESGNGRMPKEFVVLERLYPDYPLKQPDKLIAGHEKTGRYRLVLLVPFELPE